MVEITDNNYKVEVNVYEDRCSVWFFLKEGSIDLSGCAFHKRIMKSNFIQNLLGNRHERETDDELVKRTTDDAMQDLRENVEQVNERLRLNTIASAHLKQNSNGRSESNDRLQWHESG